MSDPQLERSVLESKDREELFAIAEALGARPTSRAKKSDLVTQILRSTGVEATPAEEVDKPRRTRARKAARSDGGAGDGGGGRRGAAPHGQAGEPAVESAGQAAGQPGSARRRRRRKPRPPRLRRPRRRRLDVSRPRPRRRTAARPARSRTARAATARVATAGASRPRASRPRASPPRASRPRASPTRLAGRPEEGRARRTVPPSNPSSPAQGQAGAPPGRQRPGPLRRPSRWRPTRGGRPDGGRPDGEPGNRRNRRRRGRDRSDRGGERELQGGAGRDRSSRGEPTQVKGLLDLRDEGYGFLRTDGYLAGPDDVYVSISQVRRFALRRGDMLEGTARPAGSNEKYPALARIDKVSDQSPDEAQQPGRASRPSPPSSPTHKLRLEVPGDPANLTARIVDLISPIGKGQRGLDRLAAEGRARRPSSSRSPTPSRPTTPRSTSWSSSSTSAPRRSPTCAARSRARWWPPPSTGPPRSTPRSPSWPSSGPSGWSRWAATSSIVLDGITRLARAYNLAQPATRAGHVRRHRHRCPVPPQEVLRGRPEYRGGRIVDDPGHRPGGDRESDGRGHLRGVQGHR